MSSDKSPFEASTFVSAIIVGTVAATGNLWPESVSPLIPVWFDIIWGTVFALGAGVALIGARMKNRVSGVLVEQVGLMCLFATCLVCSITLVIIAPRELFLIDILFLILGIACFTQWLRMEIMMRGIIKKGKRKRRPSQWT